MQCVYCVVYIVTLYYLITFFLMILLFFFLHDYCCFCCFQWKCWEYTPLKLLPHFSSNPLENWSYLSSLECECVKNILFSLAPLNFRGRIINRRSKVREARAVTFIGNISIITQYLQEIVATIRPYFQTKSWKKWKLLSIHWRHRKFKNFSNTRNVLIKRCIICFSALFTVYLVNN